MVEYMTGASNMELWLGQKMTRPFGLRFSAPISRTLPTWRKTWTLARNRPRIWRGRKVFGIKPLVRHWFTYSRNLFRHVPIQFLMSSEPFVNRLGFTGSSDTCALTGVVSCPAVGAAGGNEKT